MLKRAATCAAAAVGALACAGPAVASSVTVAGAALQFTAGAGEANDVTIWFSDQTGVYTVRDEAAVLSAGSGCTQVDPHAASCAPASGGDITVVHVDSGDADDVVDADPLEITDSSQISGGDGDDELYGGGDRATLDGGAGDDILYGRGNSDFFSQFHGGSGTDTLDYSFSYAPVEVELCDSDPDPMRPPCDNDGAGDNSGFENLTGGQDDDVLLGNSAANVVHGGAGDDTLAGSFGADDLVGDEGLDVTDYSARTGPVTVTLNGGADDGFANEGDDVETEGVIGGSAGDALTGDDGANVFDGGDGDDRIDGRGGVDGLVYGGTAGNDTIVVGTTSVIGAGDVDTHSAVEQFAVFGLDGADRLTGGVGTDFLLGGNGDDRLVGGAGEDAYFGGGGADSIESRDGVAEDVACGSEIDEADVDASDRVDDDCDRVSGRSTLTVSDATVVEGNPYSSPTVYVTVTRAPADADYVPFTVSAVNGTASDDDYRLASGWWGAVQPGETTATIAITITPDDLREGNETFYLDLAVPGRGPGPVAKVTRARATVTIIDDDLPPDVVKQNARAMGPDYARLSGIINPRGKETRVYFEYGRTTDYDYDTPRPPIVKAGGTANVPVTEIAITGLAAGATYHYRLVATSAAGTTYGPDATFRTPRRVSKVVLCHRGRTIRVPKSQVKKHRKHGDKLGPCKKKKRR